MAIQVWDGTKYVGAELAKFGTSGTLKEAHIWDGTKYVKVWPTTLPSPYPLTGTFEIVNGGPMVEHEVFSHTVVEPGSFTGTVVIESGQTGTYFWYVNGGSRTGGVSNTRTFTGLSVGDTIKVAAMDFSALNLSGTWSVVKN